MVRHRHKKGHPIYMCFKKIGIRAQNMLPILGSIVNMNRRDLHSMVMRLFALIMHKIFIWPPKTMRQMAQRT